MVKVTTLRTPGEGSVCFFCPKFFFSTTREDIGNMVNCIFFNLPSFTPPVRVTVGEVRYSIEIDVGGGKGQFYKTRF